MRSWDVVDKFAYSIKVAEDGKTIHLDLKIEQVFSRQIMIECLRELAEHLESKDEREKMN